MKILFAILELIISMTITQQPVKANTSKAFTLCVENIGENKGLYGKEEILKGASIEGDPSLGSVENFENATGVVNDIYIKSLKAGEAFSEDWLIDIYAKNKIPMLVLPYNITEDEIYSISEICSSLNRPVFIEPDFDYDNEKYTKTAEIIKKTAPNAALVWAVDSDCPDIGRAYPKNSVVDWVAVNINSKCTKGRIETQLPNAISLCRYFSEKSVMLNISVSHYSDYDNRYYINEAEKEMENLYSMGACFKGVSAVNYISFSEMESSKDNKNSFMLSENPQLLENYRKCTELLKVKKYYTQSGSVAYLIKGKVYVDRETAARLDIKTLPSMYSNWRIIKDCNYDFSSGKVFVKK